VPATGFRQFAVETGDALGFVIDGGGGGVQVTVPEGTLRLATVSVPKAGVMGDVSLTFSLVGRVPADGALKIELPGATSRGHPSPFVLGDISVYQLAGALSGASDTAVVSVTDRVVTLTGLGQLEPGPLALTLRNVRSPGSQLSAPFVVTTTDSGGRVFDRSPANLTVTPSTGRLYSVSVVLPMAGVTGPVNVSFATEGSVLGTGKIRVGFPRGFQLPTSLSVGHASGVLPEDTPLEVEVDRDTNTAVVLVHGPIPQGWLSLQLTDVTTPVGLSAGVFQLSTTDFGTPDRVFDKAVHALVNPVDLQMWWNGDAMSADGSLRTPDIQAYS